MVSYEMNASFARSSNSKTTGVMLKSRVEQNLHPATQYIVVKTYCSAT